MPDSLFCFCFARFFVSQWWCLSCRYLAVVDAGKAVAFISFETLFFGFVWKVYSADSIKCTRRVSKKSLKFSFRAETENFSDKQKSVRVIEGSERTAQFISEHDKCCWITRSLIFWDRSVESEHFKGPKTDLIYHNLIKIRKNEANREQWKIQLSPLIVKRYVDYNIR